MEAASKAKELLAEEEANQAAEEVKKNRKREKKRKQKEKRKQGAEKDDAAETSTGSGAVGSQPNASTAANSAPELPKPKHAISEARREKQRNNRALKSNQERARNRNPDPKFPTANPTTCVPGEGRQGPSCSG